jgi:hypothetical protein
MVIPLVSVGFARTLTAVGSVIHERPHREIYDASAGIAVVKATLDERFGFILLFEVGMYHGCRGGWDAGVETGLPVRAGRLRNARGAQSESAT